MTTTQRQGTSSTTGKKPRSPAYPGIDLRLAVEKIRLFEKREHRNAAPIAVALKHMGYSEKSGAGMVALAAMLRFGLMEEQSGGSGRRVRLTDRGNRIAIDTRPESSDRDLLIREAAMLPSMHEEIWTRYKGRLPSDDTLSVVLRTERGFSEVGAGELIRELKSTLAFAGIVEGDSISGNNADGQEALDPFGAQTQASRSPGSSYDYGWQPTTPGSKLEPKAEVHVVQIPLSPGKWAALQIPQPLTEEMWRQMEAVLSAMKPGLVSAHPDHGFFVPSIAEPSWEGLSPEALDFLALVDNGEAPLYLTESLVKIAQDNGVSLTDDSTPGQIIDNLRLLRDM
jgi:hypothetical protein